jgi:hypothetical protein
MRKARMRGPDNRRAAVRVARRNRPDGLPPWQASFRLTRSRCRSCGSRWAVVRLVIATTAPAMLDRSAFLECVACKRTHRRIAPTMAASDPIGQRVRLTLILPSRIRRWHSRGAWHADGAECIALEDATLADADDAVREWRERNGRLLAARERAATRKREREAAEHEATMALLARLAERDAQHAAEDAEAAAREAAYGA